MLGLLYVPQLATISATFPAMFPTHVRYAGFAIAYNVSTSLFGGTAPAVNEGLIEQTGDKLVPAYYMMAACVIGAIALFTMVETKGCSIAARRCQARRRRCRSLTTRSRPPVDGSPLERVALSR